MKKLFSKTLIILILTIVILTTPLVSGCISLNSTTPSPTPTTNPSPINPDWTPPQSTVIDGELPSIADVVALVKPSVVAINTEVVGRSIFGQFTEEGAGSGWIIDSDGIIVTNNHVVEGATAVTVTTADGSIYTADINSIATDSLNDLAILKIDATGLPALKRGDTSNMRVGDWVIAIGNALGQGIRATEGIVSRKGVSLQVDQGQTLYNLLETSAAINPGNSGGPLVNLKGEVIGITSAKVAQIGVEGMGYAISIDTAVPIIQDLVNNGYVIRPWLGVVITELNESVISTIEMSPRIDWEIAVQEGILLVEVVSDGPAAQAGLKAGDVIVNIGGEDVKDDQSFVNVLHKSEIGHELEIVYWRGDSKNTTSVTPIESPRS